MSTTLRLLAKKAPPASPAPAPQPAPGKAKAKTPERTPEEKAERARAWAEFEPEEHLEAVQRRQRHVREALAEFRRRWPAAFTTPVPLAIGVDKLIRAEMPEMTTSRLKEVLGTWMHSIVYLRAIAAGVERINLDDTPTGVPDEEQREHAVEELRKQGKCRWRGRGGRRGARASRAPWGRSHVAHPPGDRRAPVQSVTAPV